MKSVNRKFVWRFFLCFVLTLSVLYLCLVIAASVPNGAIKENMLKSAVSFGKTQAFSFEDGSKINAISDNYADSILLNISYNMGKGNPFVSSIDTGYYDGEEKGVNYGLYATVNEDKSPNTDYTRYWHGGAAFVRLFHSFTDVNGARQLGFYLISLLLLGNLALLVYKKRYFIALSLVFSLFAVQFYNISLSLEYQSPFAVCLFLLPLYVLFESKYHSAPLYLSCISGVAVAFFDFLTAETLAALLPLILVISVRAKEEILGSLKEIIVFTLKCLFAWGIAYVMTFAAKWTLASLVTGSNCFKTALFSVSERFGGSFESYYEQAQNIFSSVYANIGVPFGTTHRNSFMYAFAGTVIFLLVIFSLWYLFKSKKKEKNASLVILALGMLVPIRFLVLNNHSFLHCFFTYRALCSTVFALLMALWLNIKTPFKTAGKH